MPSRRLDFTADLPRKRMADALLITDPKRRALPAYNAEWEIPDGCIEADESPYQATVRGCREELGLDLSPGRLLVVDWVPAHGRRTDGVMLVYDGPRPRRGPGGTHCVPPDELQGWAWSDPPQPAQRPRPLLARQVAKALSARADGSARYLEDAVQVT
ncbi:NUDIX domain-containing protein [Micromonospora sp. NPDC047707]|uniref:NUDIX domain-containing protein n=1 Tax=Micromonospora sp. NPDC047707 TaxID=3154498 RepID=UPI00345209EA